MIFLKYWTVIISSLIFFTSIPSHAYQPPDPEILKKKAELGDAYAQAMLGESYLRGEWDVEKNYDNALEYLRKAAKQNHPLAYYLLSKFYNEGIGGVKKDKETAQKYLDKCYPNLRDQAESADPRWQTNLGYLYFKGLGSTPQDFKQAKIWAKKASKTNYPRAQFLMAQIYSEEKNKQKSLSWLRKSAQNGSYIAQFVLGNFYKNGWNVEKNIYKSINWYIKSAKNGYNEAINRIKSIAKNEKIHENYYAQRELGNMFRHGIGVEKDFVKSMKWYQEAAINEDSESLSVIKNFAKNESPIAQYTLAQYYHNDKIKHKDIELALKWAKKSHQNGYKDAKSLYENLAFKYFLYANDVNKLKNLGKFVNSKCDNISCVFNNIWKYIDISTDDKISLAEISKFQRTLVKLASVEQEKKEFKIEEMIAVNLAAVIFLPITSSSVMHSFDYDNDGVLSKNEVINDQEFASLIGINFADMRDNVDFKEMGKDIGDILKKLPF